MSQQLKHHNSMLVSFVRGQTESCKVLTRLRVTWIGLTGIRCPQCRISRGRGRTKNSGTRQRSRFDSTGVSLSKTQRCPQLLASLNLL
jgi:hypothetical protein